jgi:plasmid stabilization system protein ParE
MNGFRLSPEAARDIEEIWEYIARDSVRAASRMRQDLTDKPVLFWSVYSYLIIDNPVTNPLEIVRVLHGAQDLPRVLA